MNTFKNFPFAVKIDRCVGSCNTLNNLSNKVFAPNKRGQHDYRNRKYQQSIYHANVNVNLMEENIAQMNGGITINADVSLKKHHICERNYMWNPSTCSCENRKYLVSITDDSVITCDKTI